MNKSLTLPLIVFSLIQLFFPLEVFAQTNQTANDGSGTLGVAKMIDVQDKNVKDGSLLSTGSQGGILTTVAYDPQVLGVVSRDAAIILSSGDSANQVPVISNGTVYVLVSTKNGTIKKDDLLASSTIPGVAVKAVKEGYVIGQALEAYDNPDTKQTGKIAVDLNLHYFNSKPTFPGSLTDIFKLAVLPTKDSPNAIFKYIVAAAVVISSFVFGFLSFGRAAAKGVEALGRNPAATRIIHLGIIFNVGIVVAIVLAGLIVAFLILRL